MLKRKCKVSYDHDPKYSYAVSAEDYERDGIIGLEPMTAKELNTEDKIREAFNNKDNIIEEKFDGTRALLYLVDGGCRVFSRRISKKTGFYVENTDSVPYIRDSVFDSSMKGTVLDGEMFIPGRDFSLSCGIMNSRYDRAVQQQEKYGYEVLHVFDILMFEGEDVTKFPLWKRKKLVERVVKQLDNPYVVEVSYSYIKGEDENCIRVPFNKKMYHRWMRDIHNLTMRFPNLVTIFSREYPDEVLRRMDKVFLTPMQYYEYVVFNGGEGVMIKNSNGCYHHKRGWEYSKIKKFLTRECIILGFTEPEKEYKGKFPDPAKWDYWEYKDGNSINLGTFSYVERSDFIHRTWNKEDFTPVSKYYYNRWVGNIRLGVVISEEEYKESSLSKENTSFTFIPSCSIASNHTKNIVIEVGDCSGFDEYWREEFSVLRDVYVGKVVEVKAQEVFKKTGKMRHPRFLRLRPDKNPLDCTWKDHVGE